jgi:hypothetical protein
MDELNDIIKHYGIKGMHWGVRRNSNRPGGADGKEESDKVVDKRGKLKKHLDSMKREREWGKILREVDTMTTKDINTVKKRLDLENNLKTLTKTKMATKKEKADYLRREFMSDAEISRKVNRLQAKENLHKSVSNASKEQRELGAKIVQISSSVGVKYALTRTIHPKDVFDAYKKPKESADKAQLDAVTAVLGKVKGGRYASHTTNVNNAITGLLNRNKKEKK